MAIIFVASGGGSYNSLGSVNVTLPGIAGTQTVGIVKLSTINEGATLNLTGGEYVSELTPEISGNGMTVQYFLVKHVGTEILTMGIGGSYLQYTYWVAEGVDWDSPVIDFQYQTGTSLSLTAPECTVSNPADVAVHIFTADYSGNAFPAPPSGNITTRMDKQGSLSADQGDVYPLVDSVPLVQSAIRGWAAATIVFRAATPLPLPPPDLEVTKAFYVQQGAVPTLVEGVYTHDGDGVKQVLEGWEKVDGTVRQFYDTSH